MTEQAYKSRHATTALEVLDRAPTLDDLAETARREHRLAVQASVSMVEHAIRAGDALIAAKERVPKGQWGAWLEENFRASRETANGYARVALYQDRVRADLQNPTLRDALRYVRGLTRSDWVPYATRQRLERTAKRRAARRREATQALRRRERDAAMRRVGGSAADAYSMIRRTAQALDRASRDASTPEIRAALSGALTKLHAAEDEIVRALGVE